VDPPPIVELKIYEGEGTENDITFNMNANYFLFATLEQARPIANGRMPEEKTRLTVLTGTPVAGMVYLDRPKPAGYFIFSDLSVRHEGKYRLSFSLYEELKNAKDDDKNLDASKGVAGDAHVTHRLEVKSEPFIVYSAKKFPGLTESTSLSRMVAEQGCRVRIRRDVRMRRRDNKHGKEDWEDYESETAPVRARVSGTPDPYGYGSVDPIGRPRSASNASHQSIVNPLSRRASLQDLSHGYQHYGTSPHTPQAAYAQPSPYGPSPSQQFSQPPYMQQQAAVQPSPPQFQQQQYPPAQSIAPQPGYYGYTPAPQQAQVPQPLYAPHPPPFEASHQQHRLSVDYSAMAPDHRRSSGQYPMPPQPQSGFASQPPSQAYQSQTAPAYSQPPPPPTTQQPMYANQQAQSRSFGTQPGTQPGYAPRPPPLEPLQPPTRPTETSAPLSARPSFEKMAPPSLPPLQIPAEMAGKLEASSPAQAAPHSAYYSSTSASADSHKRSFGNVFNDRHLSQPLRQGARPSTPYGSGSGASYGSASAAYDADCDPDAYSDLRRMDYRRADGSRCSRNLPPNSVEPTNA